jgi:hypothetical protein
MWSDVHCEYLTSELNVVFTTNQPFPPLTPQELADFDAAETYGGPQLDLLDFSRADISIDEIG